MNIAICGCGIAGLAAAILAKRAGFAVTLFDQFAAPSPVGSGLVIQPVGLRVLEHLGASDGALAKGAKGFSMVGHEAINKRKVLDVAYGPAGGTSFGLGIHRASLFEALMDVARKAGITITGQHCAVATRMAPEGRYVTFDNGDTKGPFDLVIDTSGAGSVLSRLVSKPLPYGAIWGTVDWPEDTALRYDQLQQRYRQASNMIGILPIGTLPQQTQRKAALFWSMPRTQITAWQEAPIDAWRAQANALWPALEPFTAQINDHSQMTPAVYTHGSLFKPYETALVHIGDAAHRASPQLGQGANMALLDAAALVRCLELYPPATALSRYAKARRLHTGFYQWMSRTFTPMYQSNSKLLPLLRDHLLGPLSTIPPSPAVLTRLVKGNFVNPTRGLQYD